MSKRDYEKRVREEQEAAAHVFQEFIDTFQDGSSTSKIFVKSGVLFADKNQVKPLEGEMYNPKPFVKNSNAMKNALECARILKDSKIEKLKKHEKPKSNLETLKEELKLRHSERDERERLKEEIAMTTPALSYFDGGDPNSTNLFVASLNIKVTEADLMREFGLYGPLASVKIMWPRGDEKFKNSNTNCGFVAYMSRRDAERALSHMKHRQDMRVGWGKSVELPSHPVYVPQELLRLYLPPPQSGLPFNAQPNTTMEIGKNEDIDAILYDSVVKVTIPLNKKVLMLVNRVVEYVVKEGPLFEAMIMNNELGNPEYNFLFEYKSPVHVYYRWKLFSVLQGDSTKTWNLKSFRMFKGGSVWLPPVAPNYSEGMPEQLIQDTKNTLLSENQCERLINLIQNLTLNRAAIADAMVFCLNHCTAINDSLAIIVESLCHPSTKPTNKIARFYLLSDVLSNCHEMNISVANLESNIQSVVKSLQACCDIITHASDKGLFKYKVLRVLRQLDTIGYLTTELIQKFEMYFNDSFDAQDDDNSSSDEPLDGANLLKRSLKSNSNECVITPRSLKTDKNEEIPMKYFVPSKWDTIDPDEVEAQAMSSTKLYYMELENYFKKGEDYNSSEAKRLSSRKSHDKIKRLKTDLNYSSGQHCNSRRKVDSKRSKRLEK